MSVGVYVKARRRLGVRDHHLIRAYNALCAAEIPPPVDLVGEINQQLGYQAACTWCEPIGTVEEDAVIEIDVNGDGDVAYGDGMILKLSDLPADTFALRIYMS